MIGTTFGNYRIEDKIGEGGMGVVYRAIDVELDRTVAIKTLLSQEDDKESAARFLREAKAASRLQHPSIVTIHHCAVESSVRYVVMEYVEGTTLKKLISGQAMHLGQLCSIALQVADGLAVAHEHGVIHRDIKAENIMVTPRGQVKILDFGLAKLRETEVGGAGHTVLQTQVGMVMGTISHMSPEQALGGEVDYRTDIFSFGVMMYQMVTGQMPFDGPSPQAILARILNQEPRSAGELNPEAPEELVRLVHQCLQKDRVFRPNAHEIHDRLKAIEASLTVGKIYSPEFRANPNAESSNSSTSDTTVIQPEPSNRPGSVPVVGSSQVPSAPPRLSGPIAHVSNAGARALYVISSAIRWTLWLGTMTVPLCFLVYFLLGGGIIRHQLLDGTWIMTYMELIVVPVMGLLAKVIDFPTVYKGWDLALPVLAAVAFVIRHIVMVPIEKWASGRKAVVIKSRTTAPRAVEVQNRTRESSTRLAMLREYNEAKKVLFQEKRKLAFLAIDVVGSTKMKIGEDKLAIEHAFSEYKKFIERILKSNNVWKVAWTPDGIMCAFPSLDHAVNAAQEVLKGLPWFNDGVHSLKTPFNVRCGVNIGEVVFPDNRNMEEISDEAIDVAGHMQKYAAHGALWLSRETFSQLRQHAGFRPVMDQKVDGHECFEWRASETDTPAARGASTVGHE